MREIIIKQNDIKTSCVFCDYKYNSCNISDPQFDSLEYGCVGLLHPECPLNKHGSITIKLEKE